MLGASGGQVGGKSGASCPG